MKLFVPGMLLFASVAAANPVPQVQSPGANRNPSPFAVAGRDTYRPAVISPKTRQILQLRALALKLQKADGGTLSAEHYGQLQAKLDAIHSTY